MLKAVLGVGADRSQILLIGTRGRLMLTSPITTVPEGGGVPASLANLDPGQYEVDVAGGLVLLCHVVPERIPLTLGVDDIIDMGRELCRFADAVEASISRSDDL